MTLIFGTAGIPISATSRTPVAGVKTISRLGLDSLEIQFTRGVRLTGKNAVNLRYLANEYKIKLTTHAPYYINLNKSSKKKLKTDITHIVDTAEIAKFLGSKFVVFQPDWIIFGEQSQSGCVHFHFGKLGTHRSGS